MARKFILFFNIITFLFFALMLSAQTEFTQKILAVVNGEAITQTDVDEILAPIYMQYKSTYKGKELEEKLTIAKEDILNQLIEDKLILQQARKDELTVQENEIDKLVNELKDRFQTPEEFDQVLKDQNLTLADLRKRYEEQFLIKKAVSKEVLSKIIISPAKILEYYNAKQDKFRIPEQIHLRSIFLSTKDKTEEEVGEIEKKAQKIYEELKNGTEFIELVEKYSEAPNVVDSGNMGFMKRGSLLEEIEAAVFELEVGQFTKPVKTSSGYYLFKVEAKKESMISPLEKVQEGIRQKLYEKELKEKLSSWIEKLKESAFIEVKKNEKNEKS